MGGSGKGKRKVFFFEKKKQKTFITCGWRRNGAFEPPAPHNK
jgi:hypothetical protein